MPSRTALSHLYHESFFLPKNQYTEDKMPDLSGKVMIVTGGNTGIGYETVRVLLKHHAKVYLAARSPDKAHAAIESLRKEIPDAKVEFLELDLADVKKTRKAAEEFKAKEGRLDVLFNSGGVMFPPADLKTADGHDLQFGTNVLGHFALTTALLPVLLSTAQQLKSSGGFVRVINTSSSAHLLAGKDPCNPKNMGLLDSKSPQDKYMESKIGNVFFSNELARRYTDRGLFSASLNPGNIKTELQRHMGGLGRSFLNLFLYPIPLGAATQLYAGTSPDVPLSDSGSFYIPWARKGETGHPEARDEKIGKRMWAWCEEQVEKATGEKAVSV